MTLPLAPSDRTLHIYLSLAQYPILSTQIRARMRRELFARGVITAQAFEAESARKSDPFAGFGRLARSVHRRAARDLGFATDACARNPDRLLFCV